MSSGYLSIETHPEHPGLIRLCESVEMPTYPQGEAGARVRYVAKFNDCRVAHMHAHERLRHQLVDIDQNLYRVDLGEAMAAIEAAELRHVRKWIDPAIGDTEYRQMHDEVRRLKRHQRRVRGAWRWVGYVAIAYLGLRLLGIF